MERVNGTGAELFRLVSIPVRRNGLRGLFFLLGQLCPLSGEHSQLFPEPLPLLYLRAVSDQRRDPLAEQPKVPSSSLHSNRASTGGEMCQLPRP